MRKERDRGKRERKMGKRERERGGEINRKMKRGKGERKKE